MIRHKKILRFIALLVFAAMTFADTYYIIFDKEFVEVAEVEKEEEIKEERASNHKILSLGGLDYFFSAWESRISSNSYLLTEYKWTIHLNSTRANIPLFIMYCALKLHLG